MVKSLVERLEDLALETGYSNEDVLKVYECNYNYVLSTFPPHKLSFYQEVSFIRTKRELKNKLRTSDNEEGYGHGI